MGKKNIGYRAVVTFLSLTTTTWRKRGLFWLTISVDAQLAPRQTSHGGKVWTHKAAHITASRKQSEN